MSVCDNLFSLLSHTIYMQTCIGTSSGANNLPSLNPSHQANQHLNVALAKMDLKLILVPVLFVIVRAPGNIRYFISFIHPGCRIPVYNLTDDGVCINRSCYELLYNQGLMDLQVRFSVLFSVIKTVNAALLLFHRHFATLCKDLWMEFYFSSSLNWSSNGCCIAQKQSSRSFVPAACPQGIFMNKLSMMQIPQWQMQQMITSASTVV